MPINDQEKKVVSDALQEMVDSMIRVGAERDLQKEIVAKIKEDTTVKPKLFRRMARVQYAANFSEEVASDEEFVELYEELNESLKDAS